MRQFSEVSQESLIWLLQTWSPWLPRFLLKQKGDANNRLMIIFGRT